MKTFIHYLAASHNWFADRDFLWWPFSFLRPNTNEIMTFSTTLLMTACFGGLTFLMFTGFSVMNNMFTPGSAVTTFLGCFVGFFIWFNLVTKPFWNYRARLLNK